MRPFFAVAALVALTVACGGGNTPTGPTPFPFSPAALSTPLVLSRGAMRATVDGQPWQSPTPIVFFSVGFGGDRFTVSSGLSLDAAPRVSVSGPLAVGTYSASGLETPAIFILTQLPGVWSVNPFDPASSGTLTVTTASRTRVAGTFAFTGLPGTTAASAAPRVVTNGTFDISQ